MKENKNLISRFKMPVETLSEKGEKIKACNEYERVRGREIEAKIMDIYER